MVTIFKNERLRRAWMWVILPVLVYALAAGVMTWPLVRHLDDQAAGVGYGDTYMMLRQAWDAGKQLLAGKNPLVQTRIAYPEGFTSRVMWSTPLRWGPVMVLTLFLPPVLAYNLWLFATLILNGLTAYWLGMTLTRRHVLASLLGGLVFAAFPNMQGHLSVGHMDVLAMYGLPLFALCWWRVLFVERDATALGDYTYQSVYSDYRKYGGGADDQGWRTVIWGGVWFALAALGLTSQIIYNLMPLVVFSGLYALLRQRRRVMPFDEPWHTWPITRVAGMVALGGLILLIFFGPLMTAAGRAEIDRLTETGRVAYSADLLAFVSPSPFGPMADWGLVPGYARNVLGTNSAEGAAYLGVVATLLVLAGLFTRKAARPWLWVALGAMILSLGPLLKWQDTLVVLHVEDIESHITLPWALVQDWPVLRDTRTAGRFNGATALAWGALVALGASAVLRRGSRRVLKTGIAVLLGAVILFEYQLFWPYATGDASRPAYFEELAGRNDVDAVLNVPVLNPTAQMVAMSLQMIHGKPMIAGQLYRRSPQDPALLALLDRALVGETDDALPPIPPDMITVLLAESGADRVIVDTRFVTNRDAVLRRLEGALGAPEFSDKRYAVFAVPEADTSHPAGDMVYALEASNWSEPLALADFTGAFMGDAGDWYFYTPRDLYGELVIPMQSYAVPRQIAVRLDGALVGSVWADEGSESFPIQVTAGFHTLTFEAVKGCTTYPFTLACLAGDDCTTIEEPLCVSAALGAPVFEPFDSTPTALDVALDDGLHLTAYDLEVRDDPREVHVRLFWQADAALSKSYAMFVHVADTESAAPYAQYTGFPLVLTSEWDGGAQWITDATIPLDAGLPAGEYALTAGWFDPDSGERLHVHAGRQWWDAGIVYLTTITVE